MTSVTRPAFPSSPHPLVSIVIPVFNGADYLAQAIDSALAQTWPAIEVIVVDDGSDDDGATRAIISRYGDRVRLVAKPNGGVATALNAGIEAMRGAWFSWLSHDDLYHSEKVERQMAALAEAPEDSIAFGGYDVVDADGSQIEVIDACRGFDPARPLWTVLEGRINGCTLLAPARLLREAGGFDPGLPTTQDYHLWFTLVRRHRLVPVPDALVSHRRHPNQGSRSERHLVEAGLLWAEMLDRLTPEEMRQLGGSPLGFLSRLRRFLEASPYRLAQAAVQARMTECMAGISVSLAWVPDDTLQISPATMTLRAVGMRRTDEVVIDCRNDAMSSHALHQALPGSKVLTAARGRLLPASIEAALLGGEGELIVFADSSTTPDPAAWRRGLEAVSAGECEAWPLPRHGSDAGLPLPLSGAVLSRSALEASLARHGDPDTALAQLCWPASAASPLPPTLIAPDQIAPPPIAPAASPPLSGARLRAFRALSSAYRVLPWRPRRMAAHVKRALGVTTLPDMPAAVPDLPSDAPSIVPPDRARLLVLHTLGGGTQRYAELLGQHLRQHRIAPVFAWGVDGSRLFVSTAGPAAAEHEFALPDELDDAVAWLRTQGVDRADLLHIMGLDRQIVPLLAALGCPYDVTFLDYHLVASTPHLMNTDASTAARGQMEEERELAHLLRAAPHPVIDDAANLLACSQDLAARLGRLVPGLEVRPVRPPEPTRPETFRVTPPRPLAGNETLRILQLGATASHKGRQVVTDVGQIIRSRGLPIEVHILGHCYPPLEPAEQSPGAVFWYGTFAAEDLPSLIGCIRPHLAWFPARAPETFGFALSEAMLFGLPIAAQALGAYAERLAGRPFTWSLPPDHILSAEEWVDLFMALRESGFSAPIRRAQLPPLPPLDEDFYRDAYLR